ncbi:MAG: PLP-dependent transferase [Gammaproteobacteria bacterium]|nr:PLP-dependent transferase [Gammaproteobacteria bacterium]NNJ80159.1 PLP-dependent transferase [Xanthomonadales bacterium]
MKRNLKTDTWLVTAGRPEDAGDPLNWPIIPASNFLAGGGQVYARDGGIPGWEALEFVVGGLEGGEAVAFSSGMAAAAAVFDLLPVGARVALPDECYHGVSELARRGEAKGAWSVERIAVENTAGWLEALRTHELVWLESPSNPLLTVADLGAIAGADRKPGGLLVVDNTFATPLNQRPLELGADISLHSATKFIGGHSDLLGGILIATEPLLVEKLRASRSVNGATPGSLESYLALRGARTLSVRLEKAQVSALKLANWLAKRACVDRVRYPGLVSHPTHRLAAAQLDGFGAMISFDLAARAEAADVVCDKVRVIRHATSLGGVESTMERRAAVPGQEHLPPGLLRLSVGIENWTDLRDDLAQALAAAGLEVDEGDSA